MNGSEHYHEAERLVKKAEMRNDSETAAFDHRAAQVHATLALVVALREIGDQLDTLPRPLVQS